MLQVERYAETIGMGEWMEKLQGWSFPIQYESYASNLMTHWMNSFPSLCSKLSYTRPLARKSTKETSYAISKQIWQNYSHEAVTG